MLTKSMDPFVQSRAQTGKQKKAKSNWRQLFKSERRQGKSQIRDDLTDYLEGRTDVASTL